MNRLVKTSRRNAIPLILVNTLDDSVPFITFEIIYKRDTRNIFIVATHNIVGLNILFQTDADHIS